MRVGCWMSGFRWLAWARHMDELQGDGPVLTTVIVEGLERIETRRCRRVTLCYTQTGWRRDWAGVVRRADLSGPESAAKRRNL